MSGGLSKRRVHDAQGRLSQSDMNRVLDDVDRQLRDLYRRVGSGDVAHDANLSALQSLQRIVRIGGGGGAGGITEHNLLSGLQGGLPPFEFYHVPLLDKGAVAYADGSGVITGDVDHFSWNANQKELSISGDGLFQPIILTGYDSTNLYWRPQLQIRRARGTVAGGAQALVSGDYLGDVEWYGYDGTDWAVGMRLVSITTEAWDATHHGTRLRLMGVVTGDSALSTWVDWVNGQQRGLAGSVGAPTYAFQDYTGTGMWMSGAVLAWSAGGARKMSLDTAGYLSLGHAADPTYPVDGRWEIAGIANLVFWNTSANAAAEIRPYFITTGGGDAYSLWRTALAGSVYWAVGQDASESNRWAWAPATTLGASDVMRLERTGVWWLYPHSSPSLTADGEAGVDSSRRAWVARVGTVNGYLRRQLYSLTSDDSYTGTGEAIVSTCTIDGDDWGAGKVFSFSASGTSNSTATDPVTIRVRLGGLSGTVLFTYNVTTATNHDWRLSGVIICRTRNASTGTIGYGVDLRRQGDFVGVNTGSVGSLNTTANQALVITHECNVSRNTTIHTYELSEG